MHRVAAQLAVAKRRIHRHRSNQRRNCRKVAPPLADITGPAHHVAGLHHKVGTLFLASRAPPLGGRSRGLDSHRTPGTETADLRPSSQTQPTSLIDSTPVRSPCRRTATVYRYLVPAERPVSRTLWCCCGPDIGATPTGSVEMNQGHARCVGRKRNHRRVFWTSCT